MRYPLTVTLGGGGAVALGFHLGIYEGLRDQGIDISTSPLLGTSGGAHAAAAIAIGLTFEEIVPVWEPFVDKASPIWGRAYPLAAELYGYRPVPADAAPGTVAVKLLGFKRTLLWAPEVPLADAVAASASILPFTRPHKIGKRRYVDGGHRSGTSADLAPEADLQLLFAAFADKSQGLVGRFGARQIRKEVPKWEKRTSGTTVTVVPTEEIRGLSKGSKAIGDIHNAKKIRDLAIPIGRELAGTLRRDHPDVISRLPPR
jgi:predicted acylesterase/phospholipase RssA